MLKQILESLYSTEKNRSKLVPANEFIVSIEGKERYHYKGGNTKFWKRSEMYSSNNTIEPTWQKFVRAHDTMLNPAEIVDILIDKGYEVTDVKIVK